jgi:predicted Zn-dependent protease
MRGALLSGLVESLLAVGQVKQALKCIKEAVTRMPRNSDIQLTYGKVLMNCADTGHEVVALRCVRLKLVMTTAAVRLLKL